MRIESYVKGRISKLNARVAPPRGLESTTPTQFGGPFSEVWAYFFAEKIEALRQNNENSRLKMNTSTMRYLLGLVHMFYRNEVVSLTVYHWLTSNLPIVHFLHWFSSISCFFSFQLFFFKSIQKIFDVNYFSFVTMRRWIQNGSHKKILQIWKQPINSP